jgi:hypothetical protein
MLYWMSNSVIHGFEPCMRVTQLDANDHRQARQETRRAPGALGALQHNPKVRSNPGSHRSSRADRNWGGFDRMGRQCGA